MKPLDRKNRAFTIVYILWILNLSWISGCASSPEPKTETRSPSVSGPLVSEQLKQRIPPAGDKLLGTVAQENVLASAAIPKFYALRTYQPIWVNEQGPLPQAQAMVDLISESDSDGFNPEKFHFSMLSLLLKSFDQRSYLGMPLEPLRLAEFELLLTDSYLALCNQFQNGKIAPKQSGYEWYAPRADIKDPIKLLSEAVDANRPVETLRDTLPQTQEYRRLREALKKYRKIVSQGGWGLIPPGSPVHPGKRDRRIPFLRKRLLVSGDLPPIRNLAKIQDKKLLDRPLVAALKLFQSRHGLPNTGILGRSTIKALNLSPQKRIQQILINLERYRWVSHQFGKRYIAVNIADFSLRAIQQDQTALEMPVIVGNLYKQTPVFTGMMSHIVLNPYWYVPKSIVIETLLDKIKKNPSYLTEEEFTVLKKTSSRNWQEVDPEEVDWSSINEEEFDLNLRRDPGPGNPLGKMKFIFPNPYSIYLHDTNQPSLFKKGKRTLSSGCIRIAQPRKLFEFVMSDPAQAGNTTWDETKLNQELERDEEVHISLKKPIPVHMLYETAWVDDRGLMQFRDDIYGRDEALEPFLQ